MCEIWRQEICRCIMNQQMTNSLRKIAEQTKLKRVATIQPKTAVTRAMPKHCNNAFSFGL